MLPSTLQLSDVLMSSWPKFLPELVVCAGIVVLLLLRLIGRMHVGPVALVIALGALAIAVCQWGGYSGFDQPATVREQLGIFNGLLVYDRMTVFLRCLLLGFAALMVWLTLTTGIPDREDSPDFHTLLLGATLGMMLMASANHLLMVFIAVEMASLPSYALAGFLKGRRQSSEAALKYVVYGGGAAGVMLYGISLLAGKFGTGYLPEVAAAYVRCLNANTFDPVLILGTLFLLIGVGFKLAAVPFHFWCPDVFEGASAEVAGFLSVASKAAAVALLARIVLIFTGVDGQWIGAENWMAVVHYFLPALAVFAGVTATFGNLAAYLQNNLKRLLAYSTIAHAGYMMMGLCALTTPRLYLPGDQAVVGVQAVLFYLIAYLFMNLGAFAVVAFLRRETGSEDLDRMRGLVRRSPWMVVTLSFFLLSLLGMPPLVGFTAKFQIFSSLWSAGLYWWNSGERGLGFTLLALLAVGGVNTVFSAVYYLKVMRVMIIEGRAEDLEGQEPARLPERAGATAFAGIMAAAVIVLGVMWGPLADVSRAGVDRFLPQPPNVRTSNPSPTTPDIPGRR
ncbi:MAG TPA: NADH-quinone oxidoreductase subunit N [Gemmataceae bacterium]|nr:NADH-quinone oxidoreductase subunit N [Gemmataceae bacterium]